MNPITRLFGVKRHRSLPLRQTTVTTTGKRIGVGAVGVLMLTACASTPAPKAELQAAELAIANAERERVVEYAAVEMSEARKKLTAARSAVQEENMNQAQRLAQQARVDAELASVRAMKAKAEVVNQNMQKSIDTLKQEMQRMTGDQK